MTKIEDEIFLLKNQILFEIKPPLKDVQSPKEMQDIYYYGNHACNGGSVCFAQSKMIGNKLWMFGAEIEDYGPKFTEVCLKTAIWNPDKKRQTLGPKFPSAFEKSTADSFCTANLNRSHLIIINISPLLPFSGMIQLSFTLKI